jgi:hypothetical protein
VTIALASMLLQLLLTDTRRLREAKRRAAALKKEAAKLPVGSPRRKKLASLAAPVQTRLTLAAFVPLAVLLGPMVLTFMWLPERVDPASANPRPGATAVVSAQVDPDYAGEVALRSPLVDGPLTQNAAAVRPTLTALASGLQKGEMPERLAARLGNSDKSPAELFADLQKFLARPLPAQVITWRVATPDGAGGTYDVHVTAEGKSGAHAPIVVGNVAPPPLSLETDDKGNRVTVATNSDGGGPVRAVRIRYADTRRVQERAFFAPFARLGWKHDFGWVGAYLLIYVVALFAAKRALRVP